MKNIIHNKIFSLNFSDILKGLLIAILTPVFVLIQNSINAGHIELKPKELLIAALSGFVAYILKNFLTPTQVILKGEEAQKVISEKGLV